MKSLRVEKGSLPKVVHVPGSKSYANRVLILAALKKEPFTIHHLPTSSDVTFLLKSLSDVGLKIQQSNDTIIIQNSFPECESPSPKRIEVGEGGTTARFLACLLLSGSTEYTLVLGERLKERPWDEFMSFVQAHGATIELKGRELILRGPLKLPESFEVDCSRTTQFASGLQLTYGLAGKKVIPTNLDSSQSYWKMTEDLIAHLHTSDEYAIPLDWSSASYPLAFGALNQRIELPALHQDIFQSDAKFLDVLKKFNCIKEDPSGIVVEKVQEQHSIKMDVSDCLDLVPTLAYFLSHIPGNHVLSGIKNLVHKESDRLAETIKLLALFDREATTQDDELMIKGSVISCAHEKHLVLPDDHRMVMVGALLLRHHAGGSITPAEAVHKSYPDFWNLF